MPRFIATLVLAGFCGCAQEYRPPPRELPYALSTAGDGVVHLGRRVAGARPGEVIPYVNLQSPDGVTRAWVEVDSKGNAGMFELWYDPDIAYSDVVHHYNAVLGPPRSRYVRLAGDCIVWEKIDLRFEVCRSREAGEHGLIIAHAWPVLPIET